MKHVMCLKQEDLLKMEEIFKTYLPGCIPSLKGHNFDLDTSNFNFDEIKHCYEINTKAGIKLIDLILFYDINPGTKMHESKRILTFTVYPNYDDLYQRLTKIVEELKNYFKSKEVIKSYDNISLEINIENSKNYINTVKTEKGIDIFSNDELVNYISFNKVPLSYMRYVYHIREKIFMRIDDKKNILKFYIPISENENFELCWIPDIFKDDEIEYIKELIYIIYKNVYSNTSSYNTEYDHINQIISFEYNMGNSWNTNDNF